MYSGSIENGQMHGEGRLQYANGDVYEVPPPPHPILASHASHCLTSAVGFAFWKPLFVGDI